MNNVKLDDLPVIWRYNKKAWMTSEIFSEWFNEVNRKMKRANRKILLFVDSVTIHVDLNLSNVAVRFLSPNLTSDFQPLDKGIIHLMKLQALINAAEKCNSVAKFTRSVTVLDAIRWVHGAWENVSPEIIKRFFRHAGFVVSSTGEEEERVKKTTWTMRHIALLRSIGANVPISEMLQCSTTF
jgi:hypothetical protein